MARHHTDLSPIILNRIWLATIHADGELQFNAHSISGRHVRENERLPFYHIKNERPNVTMIRHNRSHILLTIRFGFCTLQHPSRNHPLTFPIKFFLGSADQFSASTLVLTFQFSTASRFHGKFLPTDYSKDQKKTLFVLQRFIRSRVRDVSILC